MKEFPRKFLSLRDKDGIHRRSKSVPPGHKDKAHPLSAEAFRAMFKKDDSKGSLKSDDEENEADQTKIEEVQRLLEKRDVPNISVFHIKDILLLNIGDGDPEQTADFIIMERKAQSGIIVPYNSSVHMVGAENRDNVTCYLDSLLFAMFAKLDAFEKMLKSDFPVGDLRLKLVKLLRIWVNLLRSGKLIRTDLTKFLQDTLSECGWSEANRREQQDTSEAFAFLAEQLQLPLLSLQKNVHHRGKSDKDDHKVVYERLLNLAVPPDPEGKGIKLEDCLEEYFNSKVEVERYLEEGTKDSTHEGFSPSQASGSQNIAPVLSPDTLSNTNEGNEGDNTSSRPAVRGRSASVIQRVVIDKKGRPTGARDGVMARQTSDEGAKQVVKISRMPAWLSFRLIPWNTLTPSQPQSDSEVALNFDQKPVVGICLKRYAMTESGQPQRRDTFIDIPDSLRLPQFNLIAGPNLHEGVKDLSTEYKIVLQSVVCHRGESLQSGHYIAFARVAPKLLTENRQHDVDPPPDYEEAQWVKFDDLETENRVAYVNDIKQALKDEMPYLLFYQVLPMVDTPRPSSEGTEPEPPSYNDSKRSIELNANLSSSAFGRLGGNYRDDLQGTDTGLKSNPPSIRVSAEFDQPPRDSLWSTSHTGSTPMGSRRESIANTESPAVTPGANSPVITPVDEPTASRLSRAASRFTLGRQSRPQSQSGEGRTSFNMARLGGIIKTSREPLAEPSNGLQASASNSMGQLSGNTATLPVSTVEVVQQQHIPSPQVKEKEKYRHRAKTKDKEKSEKQKPSPGYQPERQCAVM
ncbi:hypothetical protein QQS21_006547 [Conoideocrella luteorostrata]|uniref:ubiquitinyl hydrolase 1 n=1 Tax=Conoideocrella luteorostrata TaxID=1105319 RepID=A0AAJ0FXV6_9HYPO|nr:hypothetical protein QQS21_006547 [Conoideocrella luteorostrata]